MFFSVGINTTVSLMGLRHACHLHPVTIKKLRLYAYIIVSRGNVDIGVPRGWRHKAQPHKDYQAAGKASVVTFKEGSSRKGEAQVVRRCCEA